MVITLCDGSFMEGGCHGGEGVGFDDNRGGEQGG